MLALETLAAETFAPFIDQVFTLRSGGQTAELILSRVTPLGHRRPEALRDPFSLSFRGVRGLRVPQSIYPLTCEGLGEMEIFLTQVGDGPQGSEFEAVFT